MKSKRLRDNEEEIITLLRHRYGEYREKIGFWKGMFVGMNFVMLLFIIRWFALR